MGVSGNRNLWAIHNEAMANPIQINLDGHAWLGYLNSEPLNQDLPTTNINSSLLNFAIDGKYQQNLTESVSTNQEVSFGYLARQNKTQNNSGFFVEGTLEINYTSGLAMSSTSQIVQNENVENYNWGLSATLDYDKEQDGLGSQLKVKQLIGKIQDDVNDSIFAHEKVNTNFINATQSNQSQFESEVGYGLKLGNNIGTLTPTSGVRLVNNEINQLQIGSHFVIGNSLEFSLAGYQNFKTDRNNTQEIKFSGSIKW